MTGSGWIGTASTRIVPPKAYWARLAETFPGTPVEALQELSDLRVNEFGLGDLPPPADDRLLEAMAADGWVQKEERTACPNEQCEHEPSEEDITAGRCPVCGTAITAENTRVTVYTRDLAPTRDVDWVVVIHGMNTKGAWQEEFSWFLGTTWGRSIPVAVYKYGMVIAGVIMAWRRRVLQRDLRTKLAELRAQARAQGYGETPDVIAHSFGTWLFGHLLQDEMKPDVSDPLHFGRIILTGCVLRPDFDWDELTDEEDGLVDEVLNHYATKDPIVPIAHWTIWDSGPSGRRGFDSDQVINIRADGLGHSDLFSVDKCFVDDQMRQPCPQGETRGIRHLDRTYETYWRPFLTLPSDELANLPDISPPTSQWQQAAAPLRGTVFPFAALPLGLALLVMLIALIGGALTKVWPVMAVVAGGAAAVLGALLLGIAATLLWRVWRQAP
jgi:hypothetical protein